VAGSSGFFQGWIELVGKQNVGGEMNKIDDSSSDNDSGELSLRQLEGRG